MISEIITKVTPLYNFYRENKKILKAYESIELMWDIGEILNQYLVKSKLSPHNLWRKIYGRSEGKVDNTKKSYITREFLGRSYRIFKMFKEKNQISKDFKNLKSFTCFREAMPFFDNPKYIFNNQDKKKLLELLNSHLSSTVILDTIRQLQNTRIGIKNNRKQRLNEYDDYKKIFINFYNSIYTKIQDNRENEKNLQTSAKTLKDLENSIHHPDCKEVISKKNKEENIKFYNALSKNLSAMCQDGLKYSHFNIPENSNEIEKSFGEMIEFFITRKTFVEIRRFRKIIPVERFSKLSEMLYSIKDI